MYTLAVCIKRHKSFTLDLENLVKLFPVSVPGLVGAATMNEVSSCPSRSGF